MWCLSSAPTASSLITFGPKSWGASSSSNASCNRWPDTEVAGLPLHGVCNRIKGDGDGHMRGIGCLLTGIELFPGDVQGGSDTPAGWAMGISVDQYLKNQLQADPATRTRFGSIEMGVMVPDRSDTWTRLSYAGPNQPVAPIDNPYQMFDKLYGQTKNREMLVSVLDDLTDDFRKVEALISQEDRRMLREHLQMVRDLESELQMELSQASPQADMGHAVPDTCRPMSTKRTTTYRSSRACRWTCWSTAWPPT